MSEDSCDQQGKELLEWCKVYIDTDAPSGETLKAAAVDNMTIVSNRVGALVLVARIVGAANNATAWSAMLNGGLLCDEMYFCSSGRKGNALAYKAAVAAGGAAVNRKRLVWPSAKFKKANSDLVDIITQSVARPYSRWRLIDAAELATEVDKDSRRPQKQRRPMQQVGLVMPGEEIAMGSPRYLFTPEGFIAKFALPDEALSALGVCGI